MSSADLDEFGLAGLKREAGHAMLAQFITTHWSTAVEFGYVP